MQTNVNAQGWYDSFITKFNKPKVFDNQHAFKVFSGVLS